VPLIDHADCLLVVVDAQPGFVRGDMVALERAAWLVALAGALQVPIVVTEEEPEVNGHTDPRLVPAGAPVFRKATFGLAAAPAILRAVRATARSTAVLIGFETDVCVYQSAVGLLDDGFDVIAVEDATGSQGEMHTRGLMRLRDAGVRLTHCKALGYEWVRTVEGARTLPRPAPFEL